MDGLEAALREGEPREFSELMERFAATYETGYMNDREMLRAFWELSNNRARDPAVPKRYVPIDPGEGATAAGS